MVPSYDAQHNEFCAYVLGEDETPMGLSLGNFKTFVSSTTKGGIRGLWDADTDQIIFGTHQIAYRVEGGRSGLILPHQITREFTFLPYAQIAEFTLERAVNVTEVFSVPHGPAHDRRVAFVVDVTLHNPGAERLAVRVFPWALLIGQRFYGEPEKEVRAGVSGTLIRSYNEETGASRFWGADRQPYASAVALREQVLLQAMQRGSLRMEDHLDDVTPTLAEVASRRIFGAFEFRIAVPPGGRETIRLAVCFHKDGDEPAREGLEAILHDSSLLHDTQRYYANALADARFVCPSPEISRGVVWAKVNMLRVIKEYPQGWGSTNSPPSDILVSRDTSWFVHGYDYFLPQFSRDAIELFDRFIEPSGQMVEYVRGVSGFKTAYELNINDDTPLHIIAILHHYNATLDEAWLRTQHAIVVAIANYMLTQRDANGLLFCTAKGVDMFGISSWRNIIPYYTLDGAVTEINAEGVFALEAAAMICAVLGDTANWERFSREAQALREAMMRSLFNADTTAFVLNYDQQQNYQDNFTADEIFPVLFGVADPAQRRAILRRLMESDFTTPVGLRTISTADAWYFPSHGFGLLGGVWPDLTLWFVVALARNGAYAEAAKWLQAIYATVEAGSPRNTVPGEFAEWFDGGSLTNRGMYLSPWTGAKYLWAVAETLCGLDGYRTSGRPHVAPLLPERFAWAGAVNVHWHGLRATYVIDNRKKTIYGDMREASTDEPFRVLYAGRNVSDECETSPAEVTAIAFEDERGAVRAFLGNLDDHERTVSLAFRGATIHRRLAAGELAQIVLAGRPVDTLAVPAAQDLSVAEVQVAGS